MNQISNRITALRTLMVQQGISACIIPGADPHGSEYIADHWKERDWISGFDGSAGTVVITLEQAGLWTDSRYFLQASEQLIGSGIQLMKQGKPDTLEILDWLKTQLKAGACVGVNTHYFSQQAFSKLQLELNKGNIQLITFDGIASSWTNRPTLPLEALYLYGEEFAGKTAADKLATLRYEMDKVGTDLLVISALDDIAWLLNIRGKDVEYNPVVIAYLLVDKEKGTLFIAKEKLNRKSKEYFQNLGIEIVGYGSVNEHIKQLPSSTKIWVDGNKLNQSLFEAIPSTCTIQNSPSAIGHLKSIKNKAEMDGIRQAMRKDGVALTRFFIWLEENLEKGELTEISIDHQLRQFRSEQEHFMGESFATIAGYGAHGAIVHYRATPETNSILRAENILLLDSGGQYFDGTTDITRTVALGKVTPQQKKDFTLVLKGHIALASAIFPAGTCGAQLDVLARQELWKEGLNYGHGTGHGVGHFLCVHEGPQSIRPDQNPTALEVGMLLSNEPGMYRSNEYGIRIENLIQVAPAKQTEFGQFLQFESLTLFPLDRELIEICLLTEVETAWVDNYHSQVYEALEPLLHENEKKWLENKCRSITDLIF
jgi:Xaa-Pro aminopeptidase